ncbi:hypothetical protein LCGC14_2988070 [marine sediment metagenome]|uniref:DUF559 domain-containing protein n=1 Tax=marine sediment metagenome TaxID=412755 RepID=A0A0F8ZVP8_9ZZZZ
MEKGKTRAAILKHMAQCDGSCGSVSCGRPLNPSKLAWRAYELLLKDFEIVIPEARFGPYQVDFLLAEEWLAIEIDGTYWHRNSGWKDLVRDWYLMKYFNLPVIRIAEIEIQSGIC